MQNLSKFSLRGIPQVLPKNRCSTSRGAHAPSRAAVGALAGHIFESYTLPMEFGDAIGEGADGDTRVCSPIRSRPFVTRGSGDGEVSS